MKSIDLSFLRNRPETKFFRVPASTRVIELTSVRQEETNAATAIFRDAKTQIIGSQSLFDGRITILDRGESNRADLIMLGEDVGCGDSRYLVVDVR